MRGEHSVLLLTRKTRRLDELPAGVGALHPGGVDARHGVQIIGLRAVRHRRLAHVHVRQVLIRTLGGDRIEVAAGNEPGRNHVLVHAARADAVAPDGERLGRRRLQKGILPDRTLFDRDQRLAGLAVEDEHDAVGPHRRQGLAGAARERRVVEHQRRAEIVLPDVVMDRLKIPAHLSRLEIERDHGIVEEIVAGPQLAAVLRHRVPGRQVHQPELGVDRRRRPDRAAAVLPDVAVLRPGLVTRLAGSRARRRSSTGYFPVFAS